MEISPSDATRWRAGFRMQSRSLTFEFPKNSNNWGFQRKLDQIQNDVDIAITKGQNNFRNNENLRFSQKYGNIIGPALSVITAFFYAIIAILNRERQSMNYSPRILDY